MELLTGLSAASQALTLVKELREIDKSVDEASFKLKLAELASSLADAKMALVDAQAKVADLESKLKEVVEGAICPKCRIGRLMVDRVEPTVSAGVEIHQCSCSNDTCDYHTSRLFDSSLSRYSSQLSK